MILAFVTAAEPMYSHPGSGSDDKLQGSQILDQLIAAD